METLKILSQKSNSVVKLIEFNKKQYVIKYYKYHSRSMLIELNILATCWHENIIKMLCLIPPNKIDPIGIVMPKENICYIDTFGYNEYTSFEKNNNLLQIAYGLRYLHHNHIIHMDLKSENIMITNGICKIIDFGSSEYLFDDNKLYPRQLKCTATHRPPEAFNIGKIFKLNCSFDIWSFGIIMFETFSDIPMYKLSVAPKYYDGINNYDKLMYQFITSDIFKNGLHKTMPEKLRSCLNHDPIYRPSINNIILTLHNDNNTITPTKFDTGTNLITAPSNMHICDKRTCVYFYKFIKNMDGASHPLSIIYATHNLIHRLNYFIKKKSSDAKCVDQIILICYQLLNDTFPLTNHECQIINEIIIATNGVLFQFR